MSDKTFFGVDSLGRPDLPRASKLWKEDNQPDLYKGYSYDYQKNRFYINDIAVSADAYWESIGAHNFAIWYTL